MIERSPGGVTPDAALNHDDLPAGHDLGYLLHKNPKRVETTAISFGQVHVVYPQTDPDPYAASSFLSIAINKLFGTALTGRSKERPELADHGEAHAASTCRRDGMAPYRWLGRRPSESVCKLGNPVVQPSTAIGLAAGEDSWA